MDLPEKWQEHDEVTALIKSAEEAAVKEATGGLVNKRDELLDQVKKLKDVAKTWKDLDPEKAREALKKVRELGDDKLIEEGKIEELLQARTERMKEDFDTQLAQALKMNEELKGELGVKDSALSKSIIEKEIREAVLATGKIFSEAWPDVIHRGMQVFKINDKGVADPRDGDSKLLYGKDGTNALTYREWAESLRETAPYIWDENLPGGSGSSGNTQVGGDGQTFIAISKEDVKDVGKYRAAREKADKAGIPLQIN